MADRILKIKCSNQQCGQMLNVRVSETAKGVKVKCPKCGKELNVKINLPNMSASKTIVITCPQAKEKFNVACPQKAGNYNLTCPKCGGKHKVSVSQEMVDKIYGNANTSDNVQESVSTKKPTERVEETKPMAMGGKLVLLRRFLKNREFVLPIGETIIGRKDAESPSNFSIENDSSVSRRSVKIEVSYAGGGYLFKLEVLKSMNPVLLNNKAILPGEVHYLSYGDSIIMGKTKLRFEKSK